MSGWDGQKLKSSSARSIHLLVRPMSLLKNPSETSRCPHCGERVTAHAAGCWLCGAKLDPLRWQRPRGILHRALARWRALTSGAAD
jgi:predicted amidophosphoribosyltransferase